MTDSVNTDASQGRAALIHDDACPTCGPICGMREFGWEPNDD